jgi:hypothetical protein
MLWSKTIAEEVLGAPMSFGYLLGEVRELLDEVVALNWSGIREEWSDVCYSWWAWLYCWLGVNLPALGAWYAYEKFLARFAVWESIFDENGLKFHRRYVRGGSNHQKPHKVAAALALAREEQGPGGA